MISTMNILRPAGASAMKKRSAIFVLCFAALLSTAGADEAAEKPAAPEAVSATATQAAPEAVSVTSTQTPPATAEAPEPVLIDYNEADIQNVLRTLATRAGVNLIMGDEVTGKVTVHLENVSYEKAMHLVAETKGFAYVK